MDPVEEAFQEQAEQIANKARMSDEAKHNFNIGMAKRILILEQELKILKMNYWVLIAILLIAPMFNK